MLEVLQQDYIRTARAKGLRERVDLARHASAQYACPAPDLGRHHLRRAASAIPSWSRRSSTFRASGASPSTRSSPATTSVAMAIVVLFTLFFIVINLAVDVAYALIDSGALRARMVAAMSAIELAPVVVGFSARGGISAASRVSAMR